MRLGGGGGAMTFEIRVVGAPPPINETQLETVAKTFFTQIGYLNSRGGGDNKVAYNLVINCFMRRPEKYWLVDELAIELKTTRPTIYRHLNKLKALELIEEKFIATEDSNTKVRKGYRIRYGNLARAWDFVDAHVRVALENYRHTVEHLQKLIEIHNATTVTDTIVGTIDNP